MMVPPDYNKPSSPGVHLGYDNVVGIYYKVASTDTFAIAATTVFEYLKQAQKDYPNASRVLYIDIEGHEGSTVGYDQDFFEFQQEFLQGFLGPFFIALAMPLISVLNPREQRNDVPDKIEIAPPKKTAIDFSQMH